MGEDGGGEKEQGREQGKGQTHFDGVWTRTAETARKKKRRSVGGAL